jgi:hypothetical protein
MKKHLIAVLVALAGLSTSTFAEDASPQNWRDYIDAVVAGGSSVAQNAAGEFLPGPTSDAAQLLVSMPDASKAGLELWLNRKMSDAAAQNDWNRMDRYQAFLSCVANNDCAKVRELTAATDHPGQTRISTFEPGQNRNLGDYTHIVLDNADPMECQNSCIRDDRCLAWTYVRPGIQDPARAICWLKDSVPDLSDNDCCTSGKIEYGQQDR